MIKEYKYQPFNNDIDFFRGEVAKAVKAQLGHYPWYNDVAMNDIDQFFPNDFDEAVEYAACETLYHDAPNNGFDITMNAEVR